MSLGGSLRLCLKTVRMSEEVKKDGTAKCAQGVSYGRNFLTLSGALTVCPGGHINVVSLNKVL